MSKPKRYIRKKKNTMKDDEFSKALKKQGPEGRLMAMLYLRNPMITYNKKVNDESIQY